MTDATSTALDRSRMVFTLSRSKYVMVAVGNVGHIYLLHRNYQQLHVCLTSELCDNVGHLQYKQITVIDLFGSVSLRWVRDMAYFKGYIFLTDVGHYGVAKIKLATGEVSMVAGGTKAGIVNGPGREALFYHPWGITVDAKTSSLLVADCHNDLIRRIQLEFDPTPNNGFSPEVTSVFVSTFAGDGMSGTNDGNVNEAQFYYPNGILASRSDIVYITEQHRLRRIDTSDSGNLTVSTISLHIAESPKQKKRRFSTHRKDINTLKGPLHNPHAVTEGVDGTIFVADFGNNRILQIPPSSIASSAEQEANVSVLAGNKKAVHIDGEGDKASFGDICSMALDSWSECIYIVDDSCLRRVSIQCTPQFLGAIMTALQTSKYSNVPVELLQLISKFCYHQ